MGTYTIEINERTKRGKVLKQLLETESEIIFKEAQVVSKSSRIDAEEKDDLALGKLIKTGMRSKVASRKSVMEALGQ